MCKKQKTGHEIHLSSSRKTACPRLVVTAPPLPSFCQEWCEALHSPLAKVQPDRWGRKKTRPDNSIQPAAREAAMQTLVNVPLVNKRVVVVVWGPARERYLEAIHTERADSLHVCRVLARFDG